MVNVRRSRETLAGSAVLKKSKSTYTPKEVDALMKKLFRNNSLMPYAIPTKIIREVPVIELPVKGPNDPYAELLALGDTHIGHVNHAGEALAANLNMLLSLPHMFWVFAGDMIDAASFHNYLGDKMLVSQQIERAAQVFRPVAHKCIASVLGNHDYRIDEKILGAVPWYRLVFEKMGANAVIADEPGRGLTLVIKAGLQEYPLYMTHSSTGAIVNEFSFLLRAEKARLVPLLIAGHNHQYANKDVRMFAVSQHGNIFCRQVYERRLVLSGCYIEDPSYSEEKAYPLSTIGSPIIRFFADHPRIEVTDPRTHYSKYLIPDAYKPDEDFRLAAPAAPPMWRAKPELSLR